jgi:hypothetical protein
MSKGKRPNYKGHGKPKVKSYANKSAYFDVEGLTDEQIAEYLRDRDVSAPEMFIEQMRSVPHTVHNVVGQPGKESDPNKFFYESTEEVDDEGRPKWLGTIWYPWNGPAYVETPDGILRTKKKNRVNLSKVLPVPMVD